MRANIKVLSNYVSKEEVVFQRFNELVEVSNSKNQENRYSLLKDISASSSVEIYKKDDNYINEDFAELNNWSTNDDFLFLLQVTGTLICIPSKIAYENELVED